ncbi:hypothetical protein Vadar_004833 [Vaccinium darrowii]|uniref:Uncharacterized protein n=1 Tax=Vaccinium darrowii TaxID=229202 RepID=A0ACB7Y6F8_9ERIC|nr:hypothetical protein Vadar_004833 [Vaccinium darrowii]
MHEKANSIDLGTSWVACPAAMTAFLSRRRLHSKCTCKVQQLETDELVRTSVVRHTPSRSRNNFNHQKPSSHSAIADHPPEYDSAEYKKIVDKCLNTANYLAKRNDSRARTEIQKVCDEYPKCGLAHRFQAARLYKCVSNVNAITQKRRLLKKAVMATGQATQLVPKSIEFASFHAFLLVELSILESPNNKELIKFAIQECKRGLTIQDPVDPALEGLMTDLRKSETTLENRIQGEKWSVNW